MDIFNTTTICNCNELLKKIIIKYNDKFAQNYIAISYAIVIGYFLYFLFPIITYNYLESIKYKLTDKKYIFYFDIIKFIKEIGQGLLLGSAMYLLVMPFLKYLV